MVKMNAPSVSVEPQPAEQLKIACAVWTDQVSLVGGPLNISPAILSTVISTICRGAPVLLTTCTSVVVAEHSVTTARRNRPYISVNKTIQWLYSTRTYNQIDETKLRENSAETRIRTRFVVCVGELVLGAGVVIITTLAVGFVVGAGVGAALGTSGEAGPSVLAVPVR